jgi:hypothetical protein
VCPSFLAEPCRRAVVVAGEEGPEYVPSAIDGDTAKARAELGMEFLNLEDTLRATVDSAIEMGFIKRETNACVQNHIATG